MIFDSLDRLSNGNAVPPTLMEPLGSNRRLVELMANVTGEPIELVRRRLREEETRLGINVRREIQSHGIEPHVWSEQLLDFYSETSAFLYESVSWAGFRLFDGDPLWLPMVLQKGPVTPESPQAGRLKRHLVGLSGAFLVLGRHTSAPYAFATRFLTRPSSRWRQDLEHWVLQEPEVSRARRHAE